MRDNTDTPRQVTTLDGLTIPSGTGTEPGPIYDPSLSLLSVPTTTAETLGARLGVLQFPAVAVGRLAETTIADTLRRLDSRAEAALHSFATGTSDAGTTARRLVAVRQRARTLAGSFRPALRTVAEWWLEPILCDTAFVDTYATAYAAENGAVGATALRAACDDLREDVTGGHASEALAGVLDGTAQTHSRPVGSVVARLSLAPPLPGEDVLQTDRAAFDVDIVERARTFADAADRVEADLDNEGTGELARRITDATERSAVGVADDLVGSPPLLAAPRTATVSEQATQNAGRLTGYPTGVAWLLAKAFTEGHIGTAVYPVDESQLNWLTNPWVTDEATAPYRRRVSRALVADDVLASLFGPQDGTASGTVPLACPLCRNAVGDCGGASCMQSTLLSGIRADYNRLREAVREADDGNPM